MLLLFMSTFELLLVFGFEFGIDIDIGIGDAEFERDMSLVENNACLSRFCAFAEYLLVLIVRVVATH